MSKVDISPADRMWGRTAVYTVALGVLGIGMAAANLDEQINKISGLVFGQVAGITVGGALITGGGMSIYNGHIYRGGAQLLLATVIGIFTYLIQSGEIFSGLN